MLKSVVIIISLFCITLPAGAAVLFESTWSTATGGSDTAVRDGGKWDSWTEWNQSGACRGNLTDVVAGTGPNGLNALRELTCSNQAAAIRIPNFSPQSTNFYLRFYYKSDNTGGGGSHFVECNDKAACDYCINYMRPYADGSGNWNWSMFLAGQGYPHYMWTTPWTYALKRNVWYRFEFFVEFITATTFRVWPRIYNASNTLLYDANTIYCIDCSATSANSLKTWYAASASNVFSQSGDCTNDLMCGFNDPGGWTGASSGEYFYLAAVQIRDDTWPGPVSTGDTLAPAAPTNVQVIYP